MTPGFRSIFTMALLLASPFAGADQVGPTLGANVRQFLTLNSQLRTLLDHLSYRTDDPVKLQQNNDSSGSFMSLTLLASGSVEGKSSETENDTQSPGKVYRIAVIEKTNLEGFLSTIEDKTEKGRENLGKCDGNYRSLAKRLLAMTSTSWEQVDQLRKLVEEQRETLNQVNLSLVDLSGTRKFSGYQALIAGPTGWLTHSLIRVEHYYVQNYHTEERNHQGSGMHSSAFEMLADNISCVDQEDQVPQEARITPEVSQILMY